MYAAIDQFTTDFPFEGLFDEAAATTTQIPLDRIGRAFPAMQSVTHPSTVEVTEVDSATPWLSDALRELAALSALPAEWETSGAEAPNKLARSLAERVIACLADIDFRPHRISPSTDEGVCISFEDRDRYADIECFNSGDVIAVLSPLDRDSEFLEVRESEMPDVVARINQFIAAD